MLETAARTADRPAGQSHGRRVFVAKMQGSTRSLGPQRGHLRNTVVRIERRDPRADHVHFVVRGHCNGDPMKHQTLLLAEVCTSGELSTMIGWVA